MVAPRVVVMGVSGCGKSTVGRLLADALRVHYVEGDDLHPPDNVARMAAGTPLTDVDRHGWLQEVAGQLANATSQARGVVVSCSALKRSYRDQLRRAAPDLCFVHLQGPADLLRERLAQRRGHYMPPSLLQSQLDTLEPPAADERALALDIALPPQQLATEAERWLRTTWQNPPESTP
jgi:carbohydrate kinase (thermoresistant glucokinase family)